MASTRTRTLLSSQNVAAVTTGEWIRIGMDDAYPYIAIAAGTRNAGSLTVSIQHCPGLENEGILPDASFFQEIATATISASDQRTLITSFLDGDENFLNSLLKFIRVVITPVSSGDYDAVEIKIHTKGSSSGRL